LVAPIRLTAHLLLTMSVQSANRKDEANVSNVEGEVEGYLNVLVAEEEGGGVFGYMRKFAKRFKQNDDDNTPTSLDRPAQMET
jgi:hypothetical protein